MSKTENVHIRVSLQQKEMIKKYGKSFSEIFQLGYQTFLEKLPSECEKLAEHYHNLYTQCVNNVNTLSTQKSEETKKLDENCRLYMDNPDFVRDINNPTAQDKSWIKQRIKTQNLNITVNGFLDRCKQLSE
jgi:hypothetical protein